MKFVKKKPVVDVPRPHNGYNAAEGRERGGGHHKILQMSVPKRWLTEKTAQGLADGYRSEREREREREGVRGMVDRNKKKVDSKSENKKRTLGT